MVKTKNGYKPDFSEFTYGYALTRDLEKRTGGKLFSLPEFPSLKKEGAPGGGYDVRLESAIRIYFLQFKLPSCMKRIRSDSLEFGKLRAPSFRMPLHPRDESDQHKNLLALESASSAYVAYATPTLHTQTDIEAQASVQSGVIGASAFFKPSSIGHLPDNDEHYVAYDSRAKGFFCSEPREIEGAPIEIQIDEDLKRLGQADASNLFDEMDDLFHTKLRIFTPPDPPRRLYRAYYLAHASRIHLNAEMFILSSVGQEGDK